MVKLDRRAHGLALPLYRASADRFPLIGAVATDAQDGTVYVDDERSPHAAFVEHAFGFAQLLGDPTPAFCSALERHLVLDKDFPMPKVRMYTPRAPGFLEHERLGVSRSLRQRFVIDPTQVATNATTGDSVVVDAANFDRMERPFGVMQRFWRSATDFIENSNAVVVLHRGEPASICYAAALVDGQAEIDVLTRPEHQRLGLGKVAVTVFVRRCFDRGLDPLWDCFANNAGSMELSRSVGFTPRGAPYPFFTINR